MTSTIGAKYRLRDQVYICLDGERDYQDSLWNEATTPSKGRHTPAEWLVYIHDYTQEAMHQCSRGSDPDASRAAMRTIRKLTAMGVACMEQNGIFERVNDPPKPQPKPAEHWLMGSPERPNYAFPITAAVYAVRWLKRKRAENKARAGH